MTKRPDERNDAQVIVRVRKTDFEVIRDAVDEAARRQERTKTTILKNALMSGLGLQVGSQT